MSCAGALEFDNRPAEIDARQKPLFRRHPPSPIDAIELLGPVKGGLPSHEGTIS